MCIGLTRRSRLEELFLNLLFAECSVVFAALGFKATIQSCGNGAGETPASVH